MNSLKKRIFEEKREAKRRLRRISFLNFLFLGGVMSFAVLTGYYLTSWISCLRGSEVFQEIFNPKPPVWLIPLAFLSFLGLRKEIREEGIIAFVERLLLEQNR